MNACIAGMGWVTPLGTGLGEVLAKLDAGVLPERKMLPGAEGGREHPFLPVPAQALEGLSRQPRLRRSSTISYAAVAAGLAAVEQAGGPMDPEQAARTALVFAIGDGGVLYTRRFYEQIVRQGAGSASPMLFPETVYNAPASHLAALLGIDGASYTLVGDGAVGLGALHFAAELLETGDLEQVVVVGAEECDWILCEAYHTWCLARTPLAEGAAALVLRRSGRWSIQTHPGAPFWSRSGAAAALGQVLGELGELGELGGGAPDLVVGSGNGTFIETAEAAALARCFPGITAVLPKRLLGEAPGASALIQCVLAALLLEREKRSSALVTALGFNHQAGAVRISPAA